MILWPASDKERTKSASRKISTTVADRAALTTAILASPQLLKRQGQCIVVTGETCHYRSAARSVPTSDGNWRSKEAGDGPLKALEIGSAHGECLNILSRRLSGPCNVTGIDKSHECIQATNAKFPHLVGRSVQLDCFSEDDAVAFATLVEGIDICCVDIGGNRHVEALVGLLQQSLCDVPLIIIKARLLYEGAVNFELEQKSKNGTNECADDGNNLTKWWDSIIQKSSSGDGAGLGTPRWARPENSGRAKEDYLKEHL